MADDRQANSTPAAAHRLLLRHIALLQEQLDRRSQDVTALTEARTALTDAEAQVKQLQKTLQEATNARDEGWAQTAQRTRDLRQTRDQLVELQAERARQIPDQGAAQAEAIARAVAAESARFTKSTSWRITAPLRGALNRIRSLLR
jgi:chromosome segregation ATPase